jgi:hypothetical protein
MIEHRVDLRPFIFNNPLRASKSVARFSEIGTKLELTSGRYISAVDHQLALAELALQFIELVKVPEDEVIVAQEWYQAAIDYKSAGDYEVLSDRVDWAAKFSLMSRQAARNPEMAQLGGTRGIDLLYGELSSQGIAIKLRNRGILKDPLKAVELAPSMVGNPPEGRARLRGGVVASLAGLQKAHKCQSIGVEWDKAFWQLSDKSDKRNIGLQNPFGDDEREILAVQDRLAEIDRLCA